MRRRDSATTTGPDGARSRRPWPPPEGLRRLTVRSTSSRCLLPGGPGPHQGPGRRHFVGPFMTLWSAFLHLNLSGGVRALLLPLIAGAALVATASMVRRPSLARVHRFFTGDVNSDGHTDFAAVNSFRSRPLVGRRRGRPASPPPRARSPSSLPSSVRLLLSLTEASAPSDLTVPATRPAPARLTPTSGWGGAAEILVDPARRETRAIRVPRSKYSGPAPARTRRPTAGDHDRGLRADG